MRENRALVEDIDQPCMSHWQIEIARRTRLRIYSVYSAVAATPISLDFNDSGVDQVRFP
jgi:hypothetical protein